MTCQGCRPVIFCCALHPTALSLRLTGSARRGAGEGRGGREGGEGRKRGEGKGGREGGEGGKGGEGEGGKEGGEGGKGGGGEGMERGEGGKEKRRGGEGEREEKEERGRGGELEKHRVRARHIRPTGIMIGFVTACKLPRSTCSRTSVIASALKHVRENEREHECVCVCGRGRWGRE